MPNYRRVWIPGGTYFFTVALVDRRSTLLVDRIAELRSAFRTAWIARPFTIDAIVVLPDHLHAVWTLPTGDADYAKRWSQIKAMFVRALSAREYVCPSRAHKRERGIWQRRYWARAIMDEQDFDAHVDYVHINPVKHGLVSQTRAWPWSSFHRYVRNGVLDEMWAASVVRKPVDVRD